MVQKSRRYFIDALFVGVLIVYALAGVRLAPYHGDEATTMFVAKDWYALVVDHNLSAVLYRSTWPTQPLEDAQEFRLRMGASARYAIGFFTNVMGMNAGDLTNPWFWGGDWNNNVSHGQLGTPSVIFAARLASAFLLVISIAGIFQVGLRLGGKQYGRPLAWLATFLYSMTPTLLLNGRRAMYEGSTALFTVLLILVGLEIVRRARLKQIKALFVVWLLFGVLIGAAVAGKNSLLLVALPIAGLSALIMWWINREVFGRLLAYTVISGLVAGLVFLGFNPAWWSAPLQMPAIVAKLNAETFSSQVGFYGGWPNLSDRLVALAAYPFQNAQYYEAGSEWQNWIGDQIAAYEGSGLYGIAWGRFGIVLYPLMILGILALIIQAVRRQQIDKLLFLGALVGIAVSVFVATPLPWQRYYILLIAPWTLTVAFGAIWGFHTLWQRIVKA